MEGIVGVDEVGRGCWAGPLVVAAVILPRRLRGLKDSKLLTRAQREKLDLHIRKHALALGIGWVTPADVDALGLTEATCRAAADAVSQLKIPYTEIIMDGNYNYLADNPLSRTLIKADNLIPAVSAASIVAKVARDNYMIEVSKNFPAYQFEKHVGYGTRLHQEMLALHGICDLHRIGYAPIQSFITSAQNIA